MARFLALDWDRHQLHVVAATISRGGVRLQRALLWHEDSDPGAGQPEALGQRLRERLKSAGIAPAPVLACVGRERVILKDIRYPKVPLSEEAAVVRFQASKEMTDAAGDVVIDYTPIDEPAPAGERRAFAVIARSDIVAGYQTLCRAAGLKLAALTPRPLGIAACLHHGAGAAAPEAAGAVSAVLTVAEGWAEFCIVRGGTLLFARSMAVGNNLATEVRRNLAVYAGQPQLSLNRDVVRALYVAGNGEEASLRQRLQEFLAIPVHVLDPFAPEGQAEVTPGSRAGFAGAVGLLYLWAPRQRAPINFVSVKQPVAPVDAHRNRKLALAGVVGLLFLLAAFWGYQAVAGRRAYLDELTQKKGELEAQLRLLAPDAKHIEALKDWNDGAIPWLDELYDLTARFPYREGLRVTQLTAGSVASRNPKDKDKTTLRMTVNGIAPREDDKLVQGLVDTINHDSHARATVAGLKSGAAGGPNGRKSAEEFSLRLDIVKQPRRQYATVLTAPAGPAPPPGRDPEGEGDDLGAGFGGGLP